MSGTLVLVRHGESDFNAQDRFAGWLDVPLTTAGRAQAREVGRDLAQRGLLPDVVFTSPLSRARLTARLLLDAAGRPLRPVVAPWLIERHYGALQGRRRVDVLAEVGHDRFHEWRRGWDVRPPHDDADPESGESLHDVSDRVLPPWISLVEPELLADRCVAVVSHGNTLRVIARILEGLTEEQTARQPVPVATPFVYRWQARVVDRVA
jgi:2,3-bisphosphoglycerate-dependent phosphoglycerate mutase